MDSTDHADRQVGTKRSLPVAWVMIGVTALAVILDQASKLWAVASLPEDGAVRYRAGFFSLRLIRNPGAAFSMGEGSTWIFAIIAAAVVVGVFWWIAKGQLRSLWMAVFLGLITGGAIGNLIDRLTQPPGFANGHVIDFIDYGGWFVGNVADIWIVVGAVGLAVYFVIAGSPKQGGERD